MTLILIIIGLLIIGAIFLQKVVRWRWFRNPVEDRWLAARAIEELLRPEGYFGDVEEFTSIPLRDNDNLKEIQRGVIQLLRDPGNFVEPPRIGNEFPALSESGRNRLIELGRILEKELPNYTLNTDMPKQRSG